MNLSFQEVLNNILIEDYKSNKGIRNAVLAVEIVKKESKLGFFFLPNCMFSEQFSKLQLHFFYSNIYVNLFDFS